MIFFALGPGGFPQLPNFNAYNPVPSGHEDHYHPRPDTSWRPWALTLVSIVVMISALCMIVLTSMFWYILPGLSRYWFFPFVSAVVLFLICGRLMQGYSWAQLGTLLAWPVFLAGCLAFHHTLVVYHDAILIKLFSAGIELEYLPGPSMVPDIIYGVIVFILIAYMVQRPDVHRAYEQVANTDPEEGE